MEQQPTFSTLYRRLIQALSPERDTVERQRQRILLRLPGATPLGETPTQTNETEGTTHA